MAGKKTPDGKRLQKSIDRLDRSVTKLPENYEFIFHPGKSLGWHFARGMAYGLGMITAVAIVIPVIIFILSQIQWVPLLGDFLTDVVTRMEQVRGFR